MDKKIGHFPIFLSDTWDVEVMRM